MIHPSEKRILITGASGAIGSALAREYANPLNSLILQGRNAHLLESIATHCRAQGAQVELLAMDLTLVNELKTAVSQLGPIDLFIANAGINTNIGDDGQGEKWDTVNEMLDVNLRSVMAVIHGLLPAMRQRGSGQIAIISSLAAYFGLPETPAYSATKAALKAYGEALRGWLSPEGINVNVVMPGYVESPMCSAMPGPKPFLMSPEKAALIIRRGLERNRARISFPFPLNWGTWWLQVLPPSISIRILQWLGYGN